jgi:WD40 repeat protein/serine/threonine protein kinase
MSATFTCPDDATLEKLASGELAPDVAEPFLSHVGTCTRCSDRLKAATKTSSIWNAAESSVAESAGGGQIWDLLARVEKLKQAPTPAGLSDADQPTEPPEAAPEEERPEALPAPFGPYHFVTKINQGGMGVLYLVEDREMNRLLAFKVLGRRFRTVPGMVDRFDEEAKVTSQLQHPGIPPVHVKGTLPDERPFFAMKYVKGETLAAMLDRRPKEDRARQEDLPRFLAVFEHICQALAYAHSQNVIHRDLKPANVMVGAFGEVQLMDWGLAKRLDEPHDVQAERFDSADDSAFATVTLRLRTQVGAILGTPAYMPPEQANGQLAEIDKRSDVFGLGAILCEILTGAPPFDGPGWRDALRLAQDGTIEPTLDRLKQSQADPELIELCAGMLALKKDDRPADAGAVAQAIRLYREKVQQRLKQADEERAAAEARIKEERRRRRLLVAAAAVVFIVLTGGIVGTAIGLVDAENASVIAQANEEKAKQETVKANEARAAQKLAAEAAIASATAATNAQRAAETSEAAEKRARLDADASAAAATRARNVAETSEANLKVQLDLMRRTLYTREILDVARVCQRDPHVGQQLLYDTDKCPLDLRDLAWRFCDRLSRRELDTFTGHKGLVYAVAISPDGKLLASGSHDKTIRVLNLDEKKIDTVLRKDTAEIRRLCFSAGGKTLASIGARTARIWDVETWKERKRLDDITPNGSAFTADKRALVTRAKDGKVTVWDLETGRDLDSFMGPTGEFNCIALSPDRKVLALGTGKYPTKPGGPHTGEVHLWDVAAAKKRALLTGHQEIVTSLAFSPDGRKLAAGGSGMLNLLGHHGEAKLWNVATGEPGPTLRGHVIGGLTDLAFSPDGNILAATSLGGALASRTRENMGEIKFWQVSSGEEHLLIRSMADIVYGLAFAPDGKTLATAIADGTVKLWNVSMDQESATLAGHQQWVRCLACSPDSKTIASGSSDSTICLWDRAAGDKLANLIGHKHRVLGVSFSPDGKTLVSASRDKSIKFWDLQNSTLRSSFDTKSAATFVVYAPDGKTIAFGADNGDITIWDVVNKKPVRILKGHTERIQSLAFSPDGKSLASGAGEGDIDGTRPGQLKLWEVATGKEYYPLQGFPGAVFSVAFNKKGTLLAAGGGNVHFLNRPGAGDIAWWDVAGGTKLKHIKVNNNIVHAVVFSTDGQTVVSGSFDNDSNIKFWDVTTGQNRATLAGHTNGLQCLAVTPDGNTLVSGSGDLTVKLWPMVPMTEAGAFLAHLDTINAVRFSPDSSVLASAGYDQTLKLWDPVTGKERAAMAHPGPVTAIAWSGDSKLLAAGVVTRFEEKRRRYTSGDVVVWDVAKNEPRASFKKLSTGVWSVALSSDGRQVAWGSQDGNVTLCDLAGTSEQRILKGHIGVVLAVSFSPDGRFLASASGLRDPVANRYTAGEIILWDVASGERVKTLTGHEGVIASLAFSAGGKLASGSADRSILVWDLKTGKSLPPIVQEGAVESLEFTPDGTALLAGSDDGTVRLWDAATGTEKASAGKRKGITRATLSRDGRWVAWSNERKLHILNLQEFLKP